MSDLTSGQPASPISVDLDQRGRVTGVQIPRVPEELREPQALDEAFRAALAHRHAQDRPAAPLQRDATGRAVVRRVTMPAWRPLRELVAEAARGDRTVPTQRSRAPIGGERGVSDNDCVEVLLDPSGEGGTLEVDAGWLRHATAPNIAAAITQAFDAAYLRRDAR